MASGTDTFVCSVKVDATNITTYFSISGKHCINWHAGGPGGQGAAGINYYPSSLGKTHSVLSGLEDIADITNKSDDDVLTWIESQSLWSSQAAGGFDNTLYITSSNSISRFTDSSNVNWTKITAISSGFDGRLDTLEAMDEFDHELYITSTNSITRFADSSSIQAKFIHSAGYNASGAFYPSSLGVGVSGNVKILNDWYEASAQNYSKAYASAQIAQYDAGGGISGWYDLDTGIGITAFNGAVAISGTEAETISVADYIASSTAVANFPNSSSIISRYAPSSETRYGWGVVGDAGTIAHTCSVKPTWISIAPSGVTPLMYSFTVDATNITVYHSSPDTEDFSWRAVV